jgi:predicted RNA binding protein YcfA (HicA-like mRNA interferase family)
MKPFGRSRPPSDLRDPSQTRRADGVASPRIGCYACGVKVSEVTRMLQGDGWFLVATRGSHRQFKHATKPGRVTVPGKPSDDLAPGTLNSILKQAGLK